MNSTLLRLLFAGLLTLPSLLAIADDKPAAPATSDDPAELRRQLDEANDKLATALRSYTLLQAENEQLRATGTKSSSDLADQVASLREQLRQAQGQCSALAAENEALRVHQALASPPPGEAGGARTTPVRPGTPAAAALVQPPAPPLPAAPPAPRKYVIVEGDSLAKISRKFYGTEDRWDVILRANHATIKNEASLPVGATLTIP